MAYCAGRRREDLDNDELLRLAVTKLVEIVGEAAKNVSPELQAAEPGVPWAAAAACVIASSTTISISTSTFCGRR
ncbi:hypothetical protein I552_6809 [Mycobacterium xenopi 3993]|nr:hypothetical protein I552_6809 [Mycobacterium xenopi 3993]